MTEIEEVIQSMDVEKVIDYIHVLAMKFLDGPTIITIKPDRISSFERLDISIHYDIKNNPSVSLIDIEKEIERMTWEKCGLRVKDFLIYVKDIKHT